MVKCGHSLTFSFSLTSPSFFLSLSLWFFPSLSTLFFSVWISFPLSDTQIKNGEKKWYALKDKRCFSRSKGQILLEMDLMYNPVISSLLLLLLLLLSFFFFLSPTHSLHFFHSWVASTLFALTKLPNFIAWT